MNKALKIVFLFCFVFSLSLKAQTIVTIGNTTVAASSEKYPYNGLHDYSWANNIYLSTEVGPARRITQVAFDVVTVTPTYTMAAQKIYVRHTTATGYTSTAYPGTSGYTLVYDGTISYTATGWKTLTLTTPFDYNGTNNLEFLFENRDGSLNSTGYPLFRYTAGQTTNRIRRDYSEGSFPTTCTANCSMLANLINIRLTMVCTSTLTITPGSTTVCNGSGAALSASGVSTYSWVPSSGLSSTTGANVTASPTATTTYTVIGTDAGTCIQTKTVTVTVNPTPTVSISPASSTVCSGVGTTLTGSGASTYVWSPSTGLNVSTGSSVIASPASNITYTLTGSSNGCVSVKTVSVTVKPSPVVNVTSSSSSSGSLATGGTITSLGAYTVHTFTTSGTFTPSGNLNVEYLVVAGGGGGGRPDISGDAGGGGGGAGGLLTVSSYTVNATPYTVTVGAGGAGSVVNSTPGANGGNSVFGSITAIGGGGGGVSYSTALSGGSGGGGSYDGETGGLGTSGQGNKGGDGVLDNTGGGGGGGAGSIGFSSPSPEHSGVSSAGGNGGTGLTLSISGSSVTYAAGGGGGTLFTNTPGLGGSGIGGNGGSDASNGGNGVVNTGSGGGGGGTSYVDGPPAYGLAGNGGNGSSGIVIIRYLTPFTNCSGTNATLTASGASAYVWSPATGLSATTGAVVIASPATSTNYTVTGTTNGCNSNLPFTVAVNPTPTVSISPASSTLCGGANTTLTASGASTYAWSPSTGLNLTTGLNVVASPTSTLTYTVTGTGANGCIGTKTITVTVSPTPTVSVSPASSTLCGGGNTTLTASGATTYAWSPPAGLNVTTGISVVASPTSTLTYTVTGTGANGCTNTQTVTVTVNPLPTVTITPTSPLLCSGFNATITAGGASTYSWNPSTGLNTTTGTNVIANPTVTTNYTVTGTTANGCVTKLPFTVTVNPTLTVSISPGSSTLCGGASTTLTASGASTYTWSPSTGLNVSTGASVVASPTSTITYTVTGTGSGGCTNISTVAVTVNPLLTLTISPASPSICIGFNTTITASGASTYSWNPSTGLNTTTGTNVIANPVVTTNYTVTGTTANGCVAKLPFTVTVNPTPTVSISPGSATLCGGVSTTLTASGASTYAWSPSTGLNVSTGASVVASPTSTITYTVTGTGSTGCVNTKTVTVTVNPAPSVSISPASSTLCSGVSTTLTANGASTYVWSPSTGLSSTTGMAVIAAPTVSTTYSVTGTAGGCGNTQTAVVTVIPIPTVINTTPGSRCGTGAVVLGATASAGTLDWYSASSGRSSLGTGTSFAPSISATTTYYVEVTNSGCISIARTPVLATVFPAAIPSVSIAITAGTNIICAGTSVTFSVTPVNGGTAPAYQWKVNGGNVGTNSTSYTSTFLNGGPVTCVMTSNANCVSPAIATSNEILIAVNVMPAMIITRSSPSICNGGNTTLSAGGASTYLWAPSAGLNSTTGASVIASPTTTTTYSLTAVSAGCVNTAQTLVTVIPTQITISPSSVTICKGGSTNLMASGASVYSWAPSAGLSSTVGAAVSANPTVTTTYTVTGNGGCGQSTKYVTVTVGGTCAALVLDGGYINISGGTSATPVFIVVDGSNTSAITRLATGGHIDTKGQYNFVKWKSGMGTGNFVFPFGVAKTGNAEDYIPFLFNKTSTGGADILASTWGTGNDNLPYPGVSNVSAVTSLTGTGNALTTAVDRFWDIRTSAPATADITFSYRGSENTTDIPGGKLKAQRWVSNSCAPWSPPAGPGNTGVTSGIGIVGSLLAQTDFTPFVLVREAAPLSQALLVNAGADATISLGQSTTIGGSPTALGESPSNTYAWLPALGLNNNTLANPVASPTSTITYTVTVINGNGCSNSDIVTVTVISTVAINAGENRTICAGSSTTLGGVPTASGVGASPVMYSWSPAIALNNTTAANPVATPTATTTYTLTVTYGGITLSDELTITINTSLKANAGPDFTIFPEFSTLLGGAPTASCGNGSSYLYSWIPAQGLNSTSVANPQASPSSNTTYTLTVTELINGVPGQSSQDVVTISVASGARVITNPHDPDYPITGCCFNNYGASIYVGNGAELNIYCNLLNELVGPLANGATINGEFQNKGEINVALDWVHNAQNDLFLTQEGTSSLIGADQRMMGNSNTHFYNLNLVGTGVKSIHTNEYCHNVLDLASNELALNDYTFFEENTSSAAIKRTSGFVSTDKVILSTSPGYTIVPGNGYLSRNTTPSFSYLFPMGSLLGTARYRPVQIVTYNTIDNYKVNFTNVTPSGIYDIGNKAPAVLSLNDLYFHKIKHGVNSNTVTISTYFPPNEGKFQSLAHFEKNLPGVNYWWGSTPFGASTNVPNAEGLIYAQTNGVQTFDDEPFALAKSGFYINTANFGNSVLTGDLNGDGVIGSGEIAGDANGNGVIDAPDEIAGDINGDGVIGPGEISGDANGDGSTTGLEITGDLNGNGIIDAPNEITGDVNGDGVIDVGETPVQAHTAGAPAGNGASVVVTSLTNSGGGIGSPIGTGNTVFTPSPVPGTYTMTITPTNCGIPGRVEFEIQPSGQILESSVKYGLADPVTPLLGQLSGDVYSIDTQNPGLTFNSVPKSILTKCINSIRVSIGANKDITLEGGENILVSIPTGITGLTWHEFKIYNASNTLVYTSPVLVPGNNTIAWAASSGVYHFQSDITGAGINESIKGQFIIK